MTSNRISIPLHDDVEQVVAGAITADRPTKLSIVHTDGDSLSWEGFLADALETVWTVRTIGSSPAIRSAAQRLYDRTVERQQAIRVERVCARRSELLAEQARRRELAGVAS